MSLRDSKVVRKVKDVLSGSPKAKRGDPAHEMVGDTTAQAIIERSPKLRRYFDKGTTGSPTRKNHLPHPVEMHGDSSSINAPRLTASDFFPTGKKPATMDPTILVSGLKQHGNVMDFAESSTEVVGERAGGSNHEKEKLTRATRRQGMQLLRSPVKRIASGEYTFEPELAVKYREEE